MQEGSTIRPRNLERFRILMANPKRRRKTDRAINGLLNLSAEYGVRFHEAMKFAISGLLLKVGFKVPGYEAWEILKSTVTEGYLICNLTFFENWASVNIRDKQNAKQTWMNDWSEMRGKLLRFRMSLVLNPCKFFTYDSLDLFWPIQGLTPKPFFYDYIYGDPSVIESLKVENLALQSSKMYFLAKNSFFGIIGWNSGEIVFVEDVFECSDTEGLVDHDLGIKRFRNPWKQLIYDVKVFEASVIFCLEKILNETGTPEEVVALIGFVLPKLNDPMVNFQAKFGLVKTTIVTIKSAMNQDEEDQCPQMDIMVKKLMVAESRFKRDIAATPVHVFFAFFRGLEGDFGLHFDPWKSEQLCSTHDQGAEEFTFASVPRSAKAFQGVFDWLEVAKYFMVILIGIKRTNFGGLYLKADPDKLCELLGVGYFPCRKGRTEWVESKHNLHGFPRGVEDKLSKYFQDLFEEAFGRIDAEPSDEEKQNWELIGSLLWVGLYSRGPESLQRAIVETEVEVPALNKSSRKSEGVSFGFALPEEEDNEDVEEVTIGNTKKRSQASLPNRNEERLPKRPGPSFEYNISREQFRTQSRTQVRSKETIQMTMDLFKEQKSKAKQFRRSNSSTAPILPKAQIYDDSDYYFKCEMIDCEMMIHVLDAFESICSQCQLADVVGHYPSRRRFYCPAHNQDHRNHLINAGEFAERGLNEAEESFLNRNGVTKRRSDLGQIYFEVKEPDQEEEEEEEEDEEGYGSDDKDNRGDEHGDGMSYDKDRRIHDEDAYLARYDERGRSPTNPKYVKPSSSNSKKVESDDEDEYDDEDESKSEDTSDFSSRS